MFSLRNWNEINIGLGSRSPSNECNNQMKLGIGWIVSNEKQQKILCVGCRRNCWADLGIKQKILCVSRSHNCWVVLIKREQETWSSCDFRVVFVAKQKGTSWGCMVSRQICGMQNALTHRLELSSSCFAFLELIFWRVRCCTSCCGDRDLSHCRSCCCSRCGDMSDCYVIQTGETSSGICCICWDIKLLETWSCDCRDVIWDRKLHESRAIIWDWDRESLESGPVVCFWFLRIRVQVCSIAR